MEKRQEAEKLLAEASCERGDVFALLDAGGKRSHIQMERLSAACTAGDVLAWEKGGKERRHVVAARGTGKRPRMFSARTRFPMACRRFYAPCRAASRTGSGVSASPAIARPGDATSGITRTSSFRARGVPRS